MKLVKLRKLHPDKKLLNSAINIFVMKYIFFFFFEKIIIGHNFFLPGKKIFMFCYFLRYFSFFQGIKLFQLRKLHLEIAFLDPNKIGLISGQIS